MRLANGLHYVQTSLPTSTGRAAGERQHGNWGRWFHLSQALGTQWDVSGYSLDMLGDVARSVNDAIQLRQAVNELSAVSSLCIKYWKTLNAYSVPGLPDTERHDSVRSSESLPVQLLQ